jgi:hypothetical protein
MPRYELPKPAKGTRFAGSGRQRGTPNKISVEVKQLVSDLVTDLAYQHRLRRDFRARKVHPTIEALIWTYHLGKPRQTIDVNASVDVEVTAKLEEERRAFAVLDLAEMEALAAESQALVDKALTLSRTRIAASMAQDVVVEALPDKGPPETLGNWAGSDNGSSVTSAEATSAEPITPDAATDTHVHDGVIESGDEST